MASDTPSTHANAVEKARYWFERQGARLSARMPPPLFMEALSKIETELVDDILAKNEERIEEVKHRLAQWTAQTGDPSVRGAATELEMLTEQMVASLRVRMASIPGDRPLASMAAWLDQMLPSNAGEYMDDELLDWPVRERIVRVLDDQTRWAGDYVLMAGLVEPLYPPLGARPTTVLDIGSGLAGFPIALARLAGERDLSIVATDASSRYLELARARVASAGLSDVVRFRRLDAFRLLEELGDERPDIVTCTRSLHHFGVGGTARLLALGIHCARRGILFVDIARSISRMLMAAWAGFGSRNWRYASDAVLSVRKSFTPAELRLLAACIPGGDSVDIYYTPPAYVVIRTRTATVSDERSRDRASA